MNTTFIIIWILCGLIDWKLFVHNKILSTKKNNSTWETVFLVYCIIFGPITLSLDIINKLRKC